MNVDLSVTPSFSIQTAFNFCLMVLRNAEGSSMDGGTGKIV